MEMSNNAPNKKELDKLISIYLKAETDIINEIGRLRSQGLVDYHAVAALERVQSILRKMESDSWEYAPKMIEKQFYARVPEARKIKGESIKKHISGYTNATVLTGEQHSIIDRLTTNLMGEITEASITVMETLQKAIIGHVEPDIYRRVGLEQVALQQATGRGVYKIVPGFVETLRREGITAFIDKAGRNWSLHTYCSMASRTTSRQAEVLAVLTADPEQDLYQISSHGTTCALCAPYEGRVYSRSGTNPDFPPLAAAFGKVDPNGPDTLTNTWLNIHPNCLVPGGTVLAEGIMAHSCREYNGPVVTLITSKGNRITVTPNHPILTTEGFIPAGMLQENQKIIETTGEYGRFMGQAPDNIDIPTPVEDIGHSVIQTCGGTTVRVKGSAVQFHGDGIANSEVNIVLPECFRVRKGNVLRYEPISKPGFPSAHFGRGLLLAKSAIFQVFQRALHATNGIMGRFSFEIGVETVPVEGKQTAYISERTPTFGRDLSKSKPLLMQGQKLLELVRSGLHVSGRHIKEFLLRPTCEKSAVHHGTFDGVFGYAKMLRHLRISDPLAAEGLQRLLRQNVLVVSDLVHISTSEYHGKVYNLQTKYGFYTYNNIVTHNCLHVLLPWTSAGYSEEEIQKIKDFSNPQKNPFSVDPRTEKQVKAYRAKESARRRWLESYRAWERYRMTVGDPIPKTFSTWQKHKAADDEKYKNWQKLYRWENKRASFQALIGQRTSTGVEVRGITKHVVDRAVSRGFNVESTLDALQNPVKVGRIVIDDKGESSQKFLGKSAEIVINPETGNIISGWRK